MFSFISYIFVDFEKFMRKYKTSKHIFNYLMYSFTHVKMMNLTNMIFYFIFVNVAYVTFAYKSFLYLNITFISHVYFFFNATIKHSPNRNKSRWVTQLTHPFKSSPSMCRYEFLFSDIGSLDSLRLWLGEILS